MNVTDALNSRHTIRAFKPDPVAKETIMTILEAANRAPSWANTQPWEIFIAGGETLERLRQTSLENFRQGVSPNPDLPRPEQWPPAIEQRMKEFGAARFKSLGIDRNDTAARQTLSERGFQFFGAPVVVYLCLDRTLTPWSIFDLGMMAQSIMLAAEERGVGTAVAYTLVTYPGLIRSELDIPENHSIIIGIALGYAEEDDPQNSYRSPRRSLTEIATFKGFEA